MNPYLILTLALLCVFAAVCAAGDENEIICPNCGESVAADTEFCPYCGYGLGDKTQIRPEEIEYINEIRKGEEPGASQGAAIPEIEGE